MLWQRGSFGRRCIGQSLAAHESARCPGSKQEHKCCQPGRKRAAHQKVVLFLLIKHDYLLTASREIISRTSSPTPATPLIPKSLLLISIVPSNPIRVPIGVGPPPVFVSITVIGLLTPCIVISPLTSQAPSLAFTDLLLKEIVGNSFPLKKSGPFK